MSCRAPISTPVPGPQVLTEERPRRARERRNELPQAGGRGERTKHFDQDRHQHSQVRQARQSPGVSDPATAPPETLITQLTSRDNPGCLSASHPKKVSVISQVDPLDKDS